MSLPMYSFFESMFNNKTSDCRKLHNIANSILVLDEVPNVANRLLAADSRCAESVVRENVRGFSVLFTTAKPAGTGGGLIEGTKS